MGEILKRSVRNSELNIAKNKRAFLTYPVDGLLGCELEETDDGVTFLFDMTDVESAENIGQKSKEDQLRFLSNCTELEKLFVEYDFSLSPENIVFDINFKPFVLVRDGKKGGENFQIQYSALIGSVLQSRYKYEDYLQGGQDLYKKKKLLSEISEAATISDIKECLINEYREEKAITNSTKRLVNRRTVVASRVLIPVLAVLVLVLGYFMWGAIFQDIPYKNSVIAANNAYISNDYLGVLQALKDLEVTSLSQESKHILARSNVVTEALSDAQKENVLRGLTLRTDSSILDYWIILGRLDFDGAIDIAQRLGDDELLLFAYVKYEVYVKNDTSLTGEEKTNLISNLDQKISSLSDARNEDFEDDSINNSANSTSPTDTSTTTEAEVSPETDIDTSNE